jgi:hypothetical protein
MKSLTVFIFIFHFSGKSLEDFNLNHNSSSASSSASSASSSASASSSSLYKEITGEAYKALHEFVVSPEANEGKSIILEDHLVI